MVNDTKASILNDQGLLAEWASFLQDPANSILPQVEAATSSLICKITDLWDATFDSTASNAEFPAGRSQKTGSFILPLTTGWGTTPHLLTEILDRFGVSQNGQLLGDDGVLQTDPSPSPGLVASIVQSFTSANQGFKIKADGRNAVWLSPGQALRSDVALTLELAGPNDPALAAILTAVAQHFGFSIPGVTARVDNFAVHLQRTRLGVLTRQDNTDVWELSKIFRLTFQLQLRSYTFWITFQPLGLSFYVTQDPSQPGNPFELTPPPVDALAGVIDGTILSNFKLLQLSAGKHNNEVVWRVLVQVKLNNVAVYLQYESGSKTFSGGLILGELTNPPNDPNREVVVLKGFYTSQYSRLLPAYEPGRDIDPPAGAAPNYVLPVLGDIAEPLRVLPSSLPTAVALAEITYTIANGPAPAALWFAAKLIQPPGVAQPNHKVPSPFQWSVMDVHFRVIGQNVTEASISTQFTLTAPPPPSGSTDPPSTEVAILGLSFDYKTAATGGNATWELGGSVENLRLSMLWQFFDESSKGGLLDILGRIQIATLTVNYKYDETGAATHFKFEGEVNIGKLGLHMVYEHSGDSWVFTFDAGSSDGNATLQDVLNSIVDGAGNELPGFVARIKIPAAEGDQSPIKISVQKGSDIQGSSNTNDDRLFFVFHLNVGEHFGLSIVQLTSSDGADTKRIVRFSVNKIPLIPKVPLLESLPQPFDELEYMWVGANGDGWTSSEVDDMNKGFLTGSDKLSYKALKGTDPKGKPAGGDDDVVLKKGHHFVILNKGAVVLDHVFGASGTPAPPSSDDRAPPAARGGRMALVTRPAGARSQAQEADRSIVVRATDDTADQTPTSSTPSKGSLTFKYGPLTISAIALHYREEGSKKILSLTMDATFDLNPISFSLLGFGIGLNLNGLQLDDLSDAASHLSVELHGLALSFNKPPLMIAGGFEHEIGPSGEEIYKGGIGVSFPPYTFVGLGQYAVFKNYKSVFIYAKLDGPLITLGFATISGVRLGLGYNSFVRTPRLEEITQFPFVNDGAVSGTGNDPMKILAVMTETDPAWVTPTNNSYWFAAGLTLVAFDILTVTAVAMVQFKEAGLIISIIADAVAQMPPGVTSRSAMIVYVEIGFICEMNMVDGYFRVEAALAPTSFLLVPQCRIYGGMALVYWFDPNAHAGDWVFTAGGYHRKFDKPEWYPPVQRLGISFSVGILQVTGETYFAITPKVAMGGALIHVTLEVGPVKAWLDAGFDALVNFHPLHYLVEFHVAVGVSFDADVWFVHIHISATVGAWLTVQGPAFGGTAHVDFYMFAFDVDFGASPQAPPPMTLLEFWQMLHKPGPNVESENTNDKDPPESLLEYDANTADTLGTTASRQEGAAFKFALEDGNFPMPVPADSGSNPSGGPSSTGSGSKWFVKGGSFRFRVSSDFAISTATVTNTTSINGPADPPIYSRPMHLVTPITSQLTVTVRRNANSSIQGEWRSVEAEIKAMPGAAFGPYDSRKDPSLKGSDQTALLSRDPGLVNLMMGVIIASPLPKLAPSRIGLIRNATNMMLAGVTDWRGVPDGEITGKKWRLPPYEPEQDKYLPRALTAEEKLMDNVFRWAVMKAVWSGLSSRQDIVNDEKDGLLAQCNEVFGWSKTQLQTAPASPGLNGGAGGQAQPAERAPWKLSGKLPTKTIQDLEGKYLDLPRVGKV